MGARQRLATRVSVAAQKLRVTGRQDRQAAYSKREHEGDFWPVLQVCVDMPCKCREYGIFFWVLFLFHGIIGYLLVTFPQILELHFVSFKGRCRKSKTLEFP